VCGKTFQKLQFSNFFPHFFVSALDDEIAGLMFRASGGGHWECAVCGKSSRLKSDVSRHIEGSGNDRRRWERKSQFLKKYNF
jgi:hypothetical protein